MKLDGDIFDQGEEDDKSIDLGFTLPLELIVVGYALTAKKKKRFLQPKLVALGRSKGVSFVPIDQNRPLSEQGPFHIVLHKLFGKEWILLLQEYIQEHPDVALIDHPDAIRKVRNRVTMLEEVAGLSLSDEFGMVRVPKQLIVVDKNTACVPEEITKSGLSFPLVVKPLIIDQTSKSHELFIAFDKFSVSKLEPPLVLQEFINHGGVVFKVFVMGEMVKVVRRLSLPNVKPSDPLKLSGTFRFPRVSSAVASADGTDLDSDVAELPPPFLLEKLARELGRLLGLHLFNVDMIREQGKKDTFYVIDINYFPGFGKVPGYEHMFMDFLLSFFDPSFNSTPG